MSAVERKKPVLAPAAVPCGSCPYRQDVPSGIWARREYIRLPNYDKPLIEQPLALFMCHQADGHLCAGWCGTHNMEETLAIRILDVPQKTMDAIIDYKSPVPLFSSGRDACIHGLRDIKNPPENTIRAITSILEKKRIRRGQR